MAPLAFRREQKNVEECFAKYAPQFEKLIGHAITFHADWNAIESAFGSDTVPNPGDPAVPSLCSVSFLVMIHKMGVPGVFEIVKEVVKDDLGKEAFAASFDVISFVAVKNAKDVMAEVSRSGRTLTFTVKTPADNYYGAGNSGTFSRSTLSKAIEALLEEAPAPAAAPAAAAAASASTTPGGDETAKAPAPLAYKRTQTDVEKVIEQCNELLKKRLGDKAPAIVIDYAGILAGFAPLGNCPGSEVLRSVSALKLLPQYVLVNNQSSGLVGALYELTKDSLGLEAFTETFSTVFMTVVPSTKEDKAIITKEGRTLKCVFGTVADNSHAGGNSGIFQTTHVAKVIEALL